MKVKYKPSLLLRVGGWHLLEQAMGFGNPTAGGFKTMAAVLKAVAELNHELKARYELEFAVSSHWWHELCVPEAEPLIGYSAKWNKDRSIDLPEWLEGMKDGTFAPVGRIITPGFGLPGSDFGMLINPDLERRKLAHDMLVFSFATSMKVRKAGGVGHIIYWEGPDGIRWTRIVQGDDVLLGYELNPQLEEWKMVVEGLGNGIRDARAAGYTEEDVLFEGKAAGDPSYIGIFTDTKLAVRAIKEINVIAGANVVQWQDEFCHTRGGGELFWKAMYIAIKGGVFGGRIHFNSGGIKSGIPFSKLLAVPGGTPLSKFQQYVDPDFLPGEGPAEWLEDQRKSLAVGAEWSAMTGKPLEVEFDARFSRYADTIGKLRKSAEWTIGVFNEEVAKLSA